MLTITVREKSPVFSSIFYFPDRGRLFDKAKKKRQMPPQCTKKSDTQMQLDIQSYI